MEYSPLLSERGRFIGFVEAATCCDSALRFSGTASLISLRLLVIAAIHVTSKSSSLHRINQQACMLYMQSGHIVRNDKSCKQQSRRQIDWKGTSAISTLRAHQAAALQA